MKENTITKPEKQTPNVQLKEKIRWWSKFFKKSWWNKKKIIIAAIAGVLIAALLVLLLLPKGSNSTVTIVPATAMTGDITTTVVGSGSLDYGEKINVLIPNGLKVNKVLVEDGDLVEVGDVIATFDPASVQTQIETIEDELSDVDANINSSKGEKVSSYVYTSVSGRVKMIYAEVGVDTADIVAEHGALMILSIDGKMAVDFTSTTKFAVGDKVTVVLSDGTKKDGIVEIAKNGNYTVTLSDNGPDHGEKVTVETKEGSKIANGELYINQPISIYGSSGAIASINVSEESYVSSGTAVIRMEDVGYSAAYQELLAKREELSATLNTLITISRTSSYVATFSGTVQTVNIMNGSTTSFTSSSSDNNTSSSNNSGMSVRNNNSSDSITLDTVMNTGLTASSTNSIQLLSAVTEITTADLAALSSLTPTTGGTPQVSVQSTAFNGNIQWSPADTAFAPKTAYTAQVTLIANTGYKFPADFTPSLGQTVTVSNVSIDMDDERNQLTFTAVFPATSEQTGSGSGNYGNSGGMGGYGGSNDMSSSGSTGGSGNSGDTTQTASESEEYRMTGLVIASGDTMMLSIEVDELDILSVEKGQTAAISFDAISGKVYEGIITKISDQSTSSGNSARYKVSVTLDRDDTMRAGMNATATITIGSKSDVVMIPVAAIQEMGGKEFVYLSSDKDGILSDMREVTTGLSNGTMVEIVEGLSEGETVYYRYISGDDSMSNFGMMPGGGGSVVISGDDRGGRSGGGEMPSGGNFGGLGGNE